jgi:two-component system cell cycle sensor histidine kinase/response regulator CckA
MSDEGPHNHDKSLKKIDSPMTGPYPGIGTETISIEGLTFEQLTESGSFDLRGFRLTSIGRLLNALPLTALLVGADHRIIFANELCSQLAGKHQHIVGSLFTSLFPRIADASKADEILKTVLRTRKLRVGEGAVELGPTRMWGRMNFRPIRIGNKRFVLVLVEDLSLEKKHLLLIERHKELVGQARDRFEKELRQRTDELRRSNERLQKEMAERVNAQHSLQFSREEFRSIVDRTREGIMVLDLGEVVVYANPAAARMLGRTLDSILGERLSVPLLPRQAVELDVTRHNGEQGVAEARVERTQWNGKPAYLVVIHDITDMKRSESQLLRTQKLESLELIAGGVAHDFNNLLTANIANISLAKMKATPGTPIYEALSKAEKAASKAKDLTQQLLTFTKGKVPVKRPTSLSRLIRECVSLSLGGSNVKCELHLPEDLWTVEAEPSQLGMLFQNLLINACQAMPEGGQIVVQAENVMVSLPAREKELSPTQARYIRISLQDTGPGIAPENLSRVFEPYFSTKPKGSGLGLATAHSVVQNHGGRIEVKSRVGVGTCFYVYLPASEHDPESAEHVSDAPPTSGSGRILIMDDEEDIREVAASLLKLLGYQVDCAASGQEAIEKYESARESGNPVDAVIVDLTVPGGMGGKVTAEKLLELDPNAKVILSSGHGNDPVVSSYRQYGFKGLIRKPYAAAELGRALHTVLVRERTMEDEELDEGG